MRIRDRVKEFRRVPASELRAHPRNWRKHSAQQRSAMQSVLDSVGYAGAVLAYETPDGLEVIDGHLRAEILGNETVPVIVLDVDAREAALLLASYDKLGEMAEADEDQLAELLATIDAESDELKHLLEQLALDAGLSPDRPPTELRQLPVQPPPAMAWVLIGIPTVRFGQISELVERIAAVDDITIETTVNNG